MKLSLKNQIIWNDLNIIIAQIDLDALVKEHLESCDYKISGYWDGKNEFYEEIALARTISADLISSSLGVNFVEQQSSQWIKLQFSLKADTSASEFEPSSEDDEIGDLTLILDENLKIIDENWLIDVESPYVVAKRQKNLPKFA